ncbi:intracellular transport USO1-like [Olea europaea subsp. europaea]|uniref:Intracellular transport USO1-like n=1 Tax=Olea europaea subsp. europaea TaxID=158383 RepID=A0A8S0TZW5_OLEEU|nr:intracellular transport USO1-like [Olea europaea subsp. europaea]
MESKNHQKGLIKSLGRHIDPEKEDQIECVKIEIENKVRKILKLVKIVDQGNRENRMKIKSNLTLQIEDFHERYQSLYSLYEDLRGEVRKNAFKDKSTSTSETIDEKPESERRMATDESKKMVLRKGDVQGSASILNSKIETLFAEKRNLEERMSKEAKELKRKNSELEGQILELEAISEQKDDHFSALTKTLEENEKGYMSRIESLEAQAKESQLQINNLQTQKGDLEQLLLCKTEEGSSRTEDLMKQVNFLQLEGETMRSQKAELELQLEKKVKETSDYLIQIEDLNENLRKQTLNEQWIIEEKKGLKLQVEDLQLDVNSLNNEVHQSRIEKDELQRKFSELQTDLSNKENQLSSQIASFDEHVKYLNTELDALQNERNRLTFELETVKQNSSINIFEIEKKNVELTEKIVEQEDIVSKIKDEQKQQSKSNLQMAERKIEELAKDFRKQFEDNLRILGRRIRVVEQLIAENKEHYLKMKEEYEQENKELKERSGRTEVDVKELSLIVNDMLKSVDTVRLKFEERNTNFLNRISKVSCDLQFAKDWVMRTNKAAMQLKDDGKVDWIILDNVEE